MKKVICLVIILISFTSYSAESIYHNDGFNDEVEHSYWDIDINDPYQVDDSNEIDRDRFQKIFIRTNALSDQIFQAKAEDYGIMQVIDHNQKTLIEQTQIINSPSFDKVSNGAALFAKEVKIRQYESMALKTFKNYKAQLKNKKIIFTCAVCSSFNNQKKIYQLHTQKDLRKHFQSKDHKKCKAKNAKNRNALFCLEFENPVEQTIMLR